MEILIQLIAENVMRFPMLISGLVGTDDRAESEFRIHIFMYGKRAAITNQPKAANCRAGQGISEKYIGETIKILSHTCMYS